MKAAIIILSILAFVLFILDWLIPKAYAPELLFGYKKGLLIYCFFQKVCKWLCVAAIVVLLMIKYL